MKLKELGIIITGNTPSKNKKEFYNSSDICFFKPSDLEEDKINYLESSEEYISENARDVARILPKDALLMTCIGTIGKIGVLKKEATCNQQINAIIPNELVIPEYLGYLLLSKKEYLKKKANAPVVPIINKTDFSSIDVNICDIEEQKNIVVKLNIINELILLRKKEIEKCNGLIKSQFVEMFDGCNNIENIGNVMSICRGASPRPINDFITTEESGVNWIKIGDVSDDSLYVTTTKEKITALGANKSRRVYRGDFIMSNSMSFGRPYILKIDGCVHDGWLIMSDFKNTFNELYLYYALRDDFVQNQFTNKVNGATVKNLNSDLVKNTNIKIPSIDLQNKFAQIVEQIDKQKFVNLKIFQLLGKK